MSKTTNKSSPEVRGRVVRMFLNNQGQRGTRWRAVKDRITGEKLKQLA